MPNDLGLTRSEMLAMQLDNGQTVQQALDSAARQLVKYLQEGIDAYYGSYSPKMYKPRTGGLKRSISVWDIAEITINGDTASIEVFFNDNAFHRSLGNHPHMSDVVSLINYGWKVQNGSHRNVPRFGYYEGYHFIEDAVAKFNADSPLGITAKIVGGMI